MLAFMFRSSAINMNSVLTEMPVFGHARQAERVRRTLLLPKQACCDPELHSCKQCAGFICKQGRSRKFKKESLKVEDLLSASPAQNAMLELRRCPCVPRLKPLNSSCTFSWHLMVGVDEKIACVAPVEPSRLPCDLFDANGAPMGQSTNVFPRPSMSAPSRPRSQGQRSEGPASSRGMTVPLQLKKGWS